ncbi:MAG: Ig-like domain-containing protein [Eubacteriales bacterium]
MSTAIKSVKATVNGVEYTLTYNSSTGAYEASVTAPTTTSWNLADHVYPVSVTAEDIAGNTATVDSTDATLGNSLKLRVRETVKPIVSILSPTSGAALTSGTPTFKVKVTDPDSGIDISTLVFKVDGTQIAASKYTSTAITGGYEITYTPESAIADGSHTVTAAVKDNDGNSSETASVTFTIDTVPPTLTISSPRTIPTRTRPPASSRVRRTTRPPLRSR